MSRVYPNMDDLTTRQRGEFRRAFDALYDLIYQVQGEAKDAKQAASSPLSQTQVRSIAEQTVALIGSFGQGFINNDGSVSTDNEIASLNTGSGTITSITVSSSASGFALSGGTITSSGSITFSISNAANARTALGIDPIATKKSNLSATAAPTVNDDSGDGYAVSSVWIDLTADDAYMCLDASLGAAVWKKVTP